MGSVSRGALLLLILIGSARAGYHLMRIVILAAIGLAGMYMLHTLAQDYNKIQGNRPGGAAAAAAASAGRALLRAVFKRSADFDQGPASTASPVSPLEQVLLQDPWGCARKMVCQLAARPPGTLNPEGQNILNYLRSISKNVGGKAAAEFTRAIRRGEKARHSSVCSAEFKRCPFDANTIFKFIKLYG